MISQRSTSTTPEAPASYTPDANLATAEPDPDALDGDATRGETVAPASRGWRERSGARLRRLRYLMKERRLPDRVESYLYTKAWYRRLWVKTAFQGVLETPPLHSNPFATAEIHSLVCHRDLYQYIACIKSLLRFHQNVCIVAHNDGSLTVEDQSLLVRHLPGLILLDKSYADRVVEGKLAGYTKCLAYRTGHFIARQLFDLAMLSRTGKVVSLDSDTLFLERPAELIEWLERDGTVGKYSWEDYRHDPNRYMKIEGREFEYAPHICAGLMCFNASIVDLDVIEDVLARAKVIDWVTSQMIFLILAARGETRVEFFERSYQTYTFGPAPVFRHYWGHDGLSHDYRNDVRRVIAELATR